MTSSLSHVVCCILAGGHGSRLSPLTAHRSKPGVIFGGRYRLIDIPLSHALDSGIQETWILSQYFSSHLQEHVQGTYVDIGNGIFAIMFPEDGHGPQHYVEKPELIKKLTMKISI